MDRNEQFLVRRRGQRVIEEVARLLWRVNRDDRVPVHLRGTEDELFAVQSIRERYEQAARAVLLWAAGADRADLQAAAQVIQQGGQE